VLVVDGGLASLKLALTCQGLDHPVTLVTRLQHNARLFAPAPKNPPNRRGKKARTGKRFTLLNELIQDKKTPWRIVTIRGYGGQLHRVRIISEIAVWYTYGKPLVMGRAVWIYDPTGKWESGVLFATDPDASPQQVIEWFVMRWNVEVTFEEVRAHLGFETQRQWNPMAILRSSPAILGLFSVVCLLAHHLLKGAPLPIRQSAWYHKPQATFSDALAYVRRYLWMRTRFPRAHFNPHSEDIPDGLLSLWEDILCYAS
jgi:hypothetical protein